MSEEFEYRPLGEIGRRLEQACAALEKGGLSIDDMQLLLADIRALEQRVIVLQYKAMENMAKGLTPSGQEVPAHGTLSFSFGLPEPSENQLTAEEQELEDKNQISLIDSIEDISAAEKAERKRLQKLRAEEEKKKQVTIELKDETPEPPKKKEEVKPTNEVVVPKAEKEIVEVEEEKPEKKIVTTGRKDESKKKKERKKKSSINEGAKEKQAPTLAQKLGAKPIDNIGKSLSVNARLGIVKALFKGDADASNTFIDSLDAAAGQMAAKVLFDKEAEKREWKEESVSYNKLLTLIGRRFQA